MNKRDLSLKKYGISGKRYKELCGFCEQYPEWKRELENYPFLSAIKYSDMPKNPNMGTSDMTSETAIRIESLLSKVNIVEEAAKSADKDMWQVLIEWICYENTLEYLQTKRGAFMSRSALYERRRYFFYLLDKLKK